MTTPNRSEINKLVAETIDEYKDSPVNLLEINEATGEWSYLVTHQASYVRTMIDILRYHQPSAEVKVLEIGAFLGALCIALSKLGYKVSATDIPEYASSKVLQAKLENHQVELRAGNLRDYALPYPDETFDVVIMCQVLEHLNFNPLPVVQEINRILKPNGLFYLSLPNLAAFDKRIALLHGESIHNPIADFFRQLEPGKNFIVGLHWREYTAAEVKEMLERLGFRVERQDYDWKVSDTLSVASAVTRVVSKKMDVRQLPGKAWRYLNVRVWVLMRDIVTGLFPHMRGNHTTFAVKVRASREVFRFTNATGPY